MKKIFYLIPLFLLFLIPKAYALPDCSLISNATLYDVNSATSVSSISTNKDSELLCNTIHSAYGSSDASHGLGWNIDLTSINNGNSYYQLDVFMYSQVPDAGRIPIINSSFRGNYISVGTSNPASLWAIGTTNVSNLNYNLSTYYDMTSGRTYDVISYIFKSNVNFNKIFVPFATNGLYSGYFDLIGISLTNTGQSSLTSSEINSLLANQSSQIENNINNNINNNFNTCKDSTNMINYNIFNSATLESNGYYYVGFPGSSNIFNGSFKSNTSYTISFYGYRTHITSGFAGYFRFVYTDGTSETIGVNSATPTLYKLTSPANKSISYISLTYGNDNRTYIKDLMLSEGGYKKYEPYGEQVCNNKIDETNDKLDDLNSSVNDTNNKIDETNDKLDDLNTSINDSNSSGATDSAGSFFENFEDNDFGLSGIITAPLNTIKTITSNSCTPINLNIPFVNKNMSLPCMTDIYEEHFGSFLDIYQIITFGMISYWVCVQIYAMVKGFKNPDKDEIEVMDL